MIYLDNAATTRPCSESVDAVVEAMTETWGNPSSTHSAGLDASHVVAAAREQIMLTLGVRRRSARPDGDGLIFCGSGTEANDLAVLGVCRSKTRRGRIIISAGEHASVANAAKAAESEGFELVEIPTRGGQLDLDRLRGEVTRDTVLVSIMMVNSETGAHYDVEGAFRIVKEINPDAICHVDAVQGYMKLPFTVGELGADLCTVSAHKIHGPKGIAALYVSRGVLKARAISPVIFGGGQESGLRSGTLNVPAIAGFGAAAKRALTTMDADIAGMRALRDRIAYEVGGFGELDGCEKFGVRPNIPPANAPHILSLTLPGIKSETMLNYLSSRGICISSGSACSTHSRSISRALLAFGLTEREADCTVRVSLCRDTTEDECVALIDALRDGVGRLTRMR